MLPTGPLLSLRSSSALVGVLPSTAHPRHPLSFNLTAGLFDQSAETNRTAMGFSVASSLTSRQAVFSVVPHEAEADGGRSDVDQVQVLAGLPMHGKSGPGWLTGFYSR